MNNIQLWKRFRSELRNIDLLEYAVMDPHGVRN